MELDIFQNLFWLVMRLFVYLAFAVYVVFALVVIKQVRLMTRTLDIGFENSIKTIAYIHLIISVTVLLLALLIL